MMPLSRRSFLASPLLAFTSMRPSLAAAQQASAPLPASSNEGAWALWDAVMVQFLNSYYQPLEEGQITRKAIELLAAKVPGATGLLPSSYGTTSADHQRTFREFILRLSSLTGKPAHTFVEAAISAYCQQLKFTQYIPARVNDDAKILGPARVDMSVIQLENSRFVCLPEPGGNAAQKGIRTGDELISVDGVTVEGKSGFQLKPRLHGAVDSQVEVSVRQTSGRNLTVNVTRRVYSPTQISHQNDPSGPRIRIPGFGENTTRDLRALLKELKEKDILTIDLRGNGGGEPRFAAEAAGLLIPGPRPLQLWIKKERGREDVIVTTDEPCISPIKRLIVLQDTGTASAAELLITALQASPLLHVSIGGTKSHGKDTFQIASVVGGGLLIITAGNLTRMDGKGWAGGIKPTFFRE